MGSSYSSWDIPADQTGSQDMEGTSDPDNLGSGKASFAGEIAIVHFDFPFQKQGLPRKARYVFGYLAAARGKQGSGEEEDPRGEERTDMLPATVMSLTRRASYCYSGWLCFDLSSAILSGHGY